MFSQTTAHPRKFSVFCDDFVNFVKYADAKYRILNILTRNIRI